MRRKELWDLARFSAHGGTGGGGAVAPKGTPGPAAGTPVAGVTETPPPPIDPHAVNFESGNIWENKPAATTTTPVQQVTQAQTGPSMAERLSAHINSLEFPITVTEEQAGKLGGVDVTVLNQVLQPLARSVYQKALLDITQLMDRSSNKIKQDAVAAASTNANTQAAIQQMESTLDFTKNPNVAPIARGVLGRFLKDGMPLEKAIVKVREFFDFTAQQTVKSGGGRILPKGTPAIPPGGVGGFEDAGEGPTDWATFFGIPAQG